MRPYRRAAPAGCGIRGRGQQLQPLHLAEHIKSAAGRHKDRNDKDPRSPRLHRIPDERPAGVRAPAARKGQGAAGYGEGAEVGFQAVYGVISEGGSFRGSVETLHPDSNQNDDFSGLSRNYG